MFRMGPQESDVLAEFMSLEKGMGYTCIPFNDIARANLPDLDSVFIRVDLAGLHIHEDENRRETLLDFALETIVKYTKNPGKRTFTFHELLRDGRIREWKFLSEKYFEIFDALGRAIAIVIKIRSKELLQSESGSLASLLEADDEATPDLSQLDKTMRYRTISAQPSSQTPRHRLPPTRSVDSLTTAHDEVVEAEDVDRKQKASLAKLYIEQRYHDSRRASDTSSVSSAVNDAASQRKWKNKARFDYASVSKAKAKSEPALLGENISPSVDASRRGSTASQLPPTREVTVTQGSQRQPRFSSQTDRKKGGRSTVMGLFGHGDKDKGDRSEELQSHFVPLADEEQGSRSSRVKHKEEKFGSISGLKMLAQKVTVKRKKTSSAKTCTDDSETSDVESAVIKTVNANGEEILIKNKRPNGTFEIIAGSVDALVEALIDQPEQSYIDTFLLTFRHFMSPQQLMKMLMGYHERPELSIWDGVAAADPSTMRNRVVSLVKKWVGEHAYDFQDPDTIKVLNEFLEMVLAGQHSSYAKQITNILQHELEELSEKKKEIDAMVSETKPEELKLLLRDFDLLSQSTRKLAQQLTLVDAKMFRAIRPEEFAVYLWERGGTKHWRAHNLQAYIDRFNRVGYWVATVICSFEDVRKRVEAAEMFVKLATRCMELQNFNTAMAIFSGLNTTPVTRLKRTFRHLSRGTASALEDLEHKLSYRSNYKVYREMEAMAKPPLLPFFGLIIKDLTFMNDGNQKTLLNGLINFEKQRLICNIINSIKEHQRHKFPFVPDDDNGDSDMSPATTTTEAKGSTMSLASSNTTAVLNAADITLYRYCSSLPRLSEDQLTTLSRILEPSDGTRDCRADQAETKSRRKSLYKSGSTDALMDLINGTHKPPEQAVPEVSTQAEPSISADVYVPPVTLSRASSGGRGSTSGRSKRLSILPQSAALTGNSPLPIGLPADVVGFFDGCELSPPLEEKVAHLPPAITMGGSVRRRMSGLMIDGGLAAVLSWWKKEESGEINAEQSAT
ncbi:ras guanine nucleotide exchange factor domain-containing protein [Gaertneriomyces semiglobifer]|nr:ras guanine nucleotide exchange factor domain-containing protein [Gaertneriomyces semiglobifer]